ncbi:HlyU family transcriptional regulator [Stappia sp.]|uniref:HlyU family transcriptional regulator n=1 Tax=Stappia sp. TaxID=1870903 RepID=UPI003A991B22
MVFGKIFDGLFGGGTEKSGGGTRFDATDYKGFAITPAPTNRDGQWQVAGVIAKAGADGEMREQPFIRADLMPTAEQAAEFALRKARQIIDEQGDRLFS